MTSIISKYLVAQNTVTICISKWLHCSLQELFVLFPSTLLSGTN